MNEAEQFQILSMDPESALEHVLAEGTTYNAPEEFWPDIAAQDLGNTAETYIDMSEQMVAKGYTDVPEFERLGVGI